jgi:glycerol-1-phosphate dehydrogenase [NAD(P)+]
VEVASGIGSGDPDAVATLTEALMISGVAMQLIGHSRPASGAEHSLSHYWEMKAHLEGRKEHLHGTKVGVGCAVIAAFYERFFERLEHGASIDLSRLEQTHPSLEEVEGQVRSVLGPIADRVIAEVTAVEYQQWSQRVQRIEAIEKHAEEILALREISPSFQVILDAERAAGAPCLPREIGVDRAFLTESILNAMGVRLRFTVLRAAETLGWLEDLAEETVAAVAGDAE